MLVGGDICKALLKQEIRFKGLFPWTSLWFVVGFVGLVFCWGFFSRGVKRFMRRFSGALEVFSGEMTEVLNLPAALQGSPVTVKQWLRQQAPVDMARRKLVMERSKSGSTGGRLCWDTAAVCVLPTLSLPQCSCAISAYPCPSSSLLDLVLSPRTCSMVSMYRTCSLYLENPVPGRRSLSSLGSPLYKPGHSCRANGLNKISFEWSICQLYSLGCVKNGSSPSHMF